MFAGVTYGQVFIAPTHSMLQCSIWGTSVSAHEYDNFCVSYGMRWSLVCHAAAHVIGDTKDVINMCTNTGLPKEAPQKVQQRRAGALPCPVLHTIPTRLALKIAAEKLPGRLCPLSDT